LATRAIDERERTEAGSYICTKTATKENLILEQVIPKQCTYQSSGN
jgi:hypothetical protein